MDDIIKKAHEEWKAAKDKYQARCEAAHLTQVADKLAACRMFKGTENLQEVCALLGTSQGVEFCVANSFPSLETFRLFKPKHPEQYGVYIDAGDISVENPGTIILVGNTNATVRFNTIERHKVVTIHGAKATVVAEQWAVVRVIAAPGTAIEQITKDHAIIL
jgi:hypothetical protein